MKNKFEGFYISENLLAFPGQIAIIKLTYPRLFLRFQYDHEGYFANFNEWKSKLINIQWLDGSDKPSNNKEVDVILTDCWNFLTLHEREEERLYDESNGYDDEDF